MKKFLQKLGLWKPAAPAGPACNCGSWPNPSWTQADFERKHEACKKCPVHSGGRGSVEVIIHERSEKEWRVPEDRDEKKCLQEILGGKPCGLCGICNPNVHGVAGGGGPEIPKEAAKNTTMNTRTKPFDITEADSKNICEAREALVKIRDSVSLILRERATSEAGKVKEVTDAMIKRKEFADYIDEVIADLEGLLGYY